MKFILAYFMLAVLIGLTGCATQSLTAPPGRLLGEYASCLSDQRGLDPPNGGLGIVPKGSGGFEKTGQDQVIADCLAVLTEKLADGSALTNYPRDVSSKLPPFDTDTKRLMEKTPFNEFLDCYLGPVDPLDYQGRALRGHIALSVLGQYLAAEIKDSPAADRAKYATRAISLLTSTELSLRSSAFTMIKIAVKNVTKEGTVPTPSNPADNPLRHVANIDRISKVVTVAAMGDEVLIDNTASIIGQFIAKAVTKASPYDLAREAAEQAVNTFARIKILENYEAAYFADAYNTLTELECGKPTIDSDKPNSRWMTSQFDANFETPEPPKDSTTQCILASKPAADYSKGKGPVKWQAWDSVLADACASLSVSAATDHTTCIPTDQQVNDKASNMGLVMPVKADLPAAVAQGIKPSPKTKLKPAV